MPIENPNGVISGLDPASPAQTELGEDIGAHIRNLKLLLQQQFPGSGGSGFSITITATETEINYLGGLVDNVQNQLNESLNNRVKTVPTATSGHLPAFDSTGNIYDTGIPLAAIQGLLS